MHEGEQVATAEQVRRLVVAQFPQWADRPVTPVAEHGTDHVLYRLVGQRGDDLVVRMPRAPWAVDQAHSDAAWLPRLAERLPVAVPAPVALGEPGEGYPWPWSVAPWLPGRSPTAFDPGLDRLGDDLAAVVLALGRVDPTGGPVKEPGQRGTPLHHWDDAVRTALEQMAALPEVVARLDLARVTELWQDAVAAPEWAGPPSWFHGDLPGNLLVEPAGRLTGVIDWGAVGIGDPAPDLQPAWSLLPPEGRRRFRAALSGAVDADTWRRGRGWSIGPACTGIPYYRETVPAFTERGLRTLETMLADAS